MAPEKFKLSNVQKLMCEMKNDAGEMFYRPGRFFKIRCFLLLKWINCVSKKWDQALRF